MLYQNSDLFQENLMQKSIFGVILFLFLLPISPVFSQEYTDTNPTLTVSLDSQSNFVYQDSEGYTIVVGVIENNDPLAFLTNVIIQAKFFDDFNPNPLEISEGNTVLKVIPPNGKSPFIIRSENSNPNITEASMSILNFDTSESMKNSLLVSVNDVFLDPIFDLSDSTYTLSFSGELQNGNAQISDTVVHLTFYDVFDRIIQVSTIEIGDVDIDEKISLELTEKINSSAVGFFIFSESDKFYFPFVNVKIPSPQIVTKLVTISDVVVTDTLGKKLSEIKTGSIVKIESETLIQFTTDKIANETSYTYYIQIKESSSNPDMPPTVEYIEKFDGRFIGNGLELQSLDWIPEKKGLFFIETFLWDRNNIPLAAQGPFVLILVN
jgi:hypothetical protein